MESMITTHVGSIRFPANPNQNGIQDNGITWTELYYKKDLNTPIPSWHVSILNIFADDSFKPVHAYSSYSQIEHTDIFHEISNDEIHFFMGIKVARKHNPGMLY